LHGLGRSQSISAQTTLTRVVAATMRCGSRRSRSRNHPRTHASANTHSPTNTCAHAARTAPHGTQRDVAIPATTMCEAEVLRVWRRPFRRGKEARRLAFRCTGHRDGVRGTSANAQGIAPAGVRAQMASKPRGAEKSMVVRCARGLCGRGCGALNRTRCSGGGCNDDSSCCPSARRRSRDGSAADARAPDHVVSTSKITCPLQTGARPA